MEIGGLNSSFNYSNTMIYGARKEIFEKNFNINSKAIEQVMDTSDTSNRKVVGVTTFPVSENVKIGVMAYMPKESTSKDPIIQMEYTDTSGDKKIYNIHVNEVNPENASDLEMFAYLTYKGIAGEKIPNALNNYDAYSRIKDCDGDYYHHDYKNAETRFLNEKINAQELLNRVYSWISKIQHPDAQMTARWCEWLQNLFKEN